MDELFEKPQFLTTNRVYEQYATEYTLPDDDLMVELTRRTHLGFTTAGMLSGPLQGRLLQMFCQMLDAKRVLEIGTYTGYSSIYMARGMSEDGVLHTIDNNPEVADLAEEFISRAGLTRNIILHQGDAMDLIPLIEGPLDLVFIDADKENYMNYYNLCFDKVRKGGFIIADNILWYGRVFDGNHYTDKETKGIIAFNTFVRNDHRVENLLLPVRDGLMILRKA